MRSDTRTTPTLYESQPPFFEAAALSRKMSSRAGHRLARGRTSMSGVESLLWISPSSCKLLSWDSLKASPSSFRSRRQGT